MKILSCVNGRVIYGNCEADDTLLEISSFTHYTVGELCGIVDEIVQEEERKAIIGHWIVDYPTNLIKCDVCGNDALTDITSGKQYKSRYCPTCGCRMKGEADK